MEAYLWVLWLVLAIVFLIIESASDEFISLWFTAGSIVALVLALCKVNWYIQLSVFVVVSIILVLLLRPVVKKFFQHNESKTNIDSFVGETAVVTKQIEPFEVGEVKFKGNIWLAISANDEVLKEGERVFIVAIEGAKLIVKRYVENKEVEI